ncbi:glycosyltransferase family 4 protein [Calothrix sp. PCC 7507]|uniref:glycosyltransferase family 4 protein n=1 Tax=Calothrix sp. PCC 7507 TaxID=99598 RepID=UPI00029F2ADC|nr:glycosyltransferase family 4 protein [Calothrix sp. PCC 7507]AFY30865.1 glycosyl transferase group 1 [Calothrix sp. PCC 7507]
MRILSLNCYILGHITYQNILEKTFRESIPEVELYSLHLTDYYKEDFLGRLVHLLLRQRFPGSSKTDYDFHRLRTEVANSFFAHRCLAQAIKKYQPDLLHIHTQGIALLSASLFRKIPSVISIDCTTAPIAASHSSPANITYQPILALEKQCFENAAHIVACSDWARQSVIEDYAISPKKVTTIPYGMPLEQFEIIQRPRNLTSNKTRLLFVGNDFTRKGGYDLLNIFLEHFIDTCELNIVTNASIDIPEIPSIQLHKGIRPMSPELFQLYQDADIFVLPTHEDVYGVVFIEAMASGLPCIGTKVMAVPELVKNGVNGFTIPPKDKNSLYGVLRKLVDSPELRLSMGLAGRKIAKETFDAKINCRKLVSVFDECL